MLPNDIKLARLQSDKSKHPAMHQYYELTIEECKLLTGHVYFVTRFGTLANAKVNGRVKTWKRDPSHIEIPCKYGLYEYFTATWIDGKCNETLVKLLD